MLNYVIHRLLITIVLLFFLSFLAFALLKIMPGDTASAILGTEASKEQIEELRRELGLDRPFLVQYGSWLWDIFHGDFGYSYKYNEKITNLFAVRLPITLYLSIIALIISIILGISAGIYCAIRRNSFLDQIVSVLATVGISIPLFWLGIIGIYVFGLILGWLPVQGWTSPFEDFLLSLKQVIMPVILLAIPGIGVMARQTRSAMLEVIHQDYVRTAWSKGLKEQKIVFTHCLKNALIPVVTLLGLHLRVLVGGSVIVETVFNIPGMGRLLVGGAFNKDILVVQAGVLLIGTVVCLANLLVDLSYGWMDPRIKYE